MRQPLFWLRISLVVLVVASAFGLWAILDVSKNGDRPLTTFVAVVSFLAAFGALMIAVFAGRSAGLQRHARNPANLIAAWTVTPALWGEFIARDADRSADGKTLQLLFRPKPRRKPVEIRAARGVLMIDGLPIQIEPRGFNATLRVDWLPGRPECLEFHVLVPNAINGRISTLPGWFRAPVSPPEREAARTAFAAYTAALAGGQLSNPGGHRLAVRICVALAIVLLPLSALGFWMNAQGIMAGELLPFLLAIIGTMGGGGAALVALIVWWVMLRRR